MDNLARLLLRFLLVPLGYLCAVMAGAAVILVGEWRIGSLFEAAPPDAAAMGFIVAIVAAVTVVLVLLSLMWLVAAAGILFSEAFAVRSWLFHAGNGVVSAWIGAQLFATDAAGGAAVVAEDPFYVIAAGLAAGLVYWLVAGSTAGFFKPILRTGARGAPRLPPHTPAQGTPPQESPEQGLPEQVPPRPNLPPPA